MQIVNVLPLVVWMSDDQGNVNWLNECGRVYTGEVPWEKVVHPDDFSPSPPQACTREYRLRRWSGDYRWFSVTSTPWDGGWVMTAIDIEDHRRLVAAANEQVAVRDRFLAMLSHELRNPLAAILNAARLMQIIAPDALCAGVVTRQAGHMASLIDNLLDVSRVTRDKIHLSRRPMVLGDAIQAAVESVNAIDDKKIDFICEVDPVVVVGDRTRLTQVVGNLLSNAAKFTPPRGRITLTCYRDRAEAVIRVTDTGIGVDPSKIGNLFDLFFQVDSTLDRKCGGLGIGLTLVKSLVAMHDGTVRATSQGIGHGCEFEVRIPASDCSVTAGIEPGHHTSKSRVVIVDDMADSARMLAEILSIDGHTVSVYGSGEAALVAMDDVRPDAVLVDIALPGMDGYEVARQVRVRHPSALLISITGFSQDDCRHRSVGAGFDHHLVKPVKMSVLSQILAAL